MTNIVLGNNADFNSRMQISTITAGNNSGTTDIPVTNDDIVEGNETFSMSLTVPSSLGPGITTGTITSATVTIIDTSSELCSISTNCLHCCGQLADITVTFTQNQFVGIESTGFVIVHFELNGGVSLYPFNVTVHASEMSPVSAEGNSIMYIIIIIFT